MSGSTLTWSLTFHWDGGDAQLDNAYIRKDGANIWSNAGRVHNYEGKDSRGEYNLPIANGTTSIGGTQTITFGITKYNGVALSGSFRVTAATAPTGGAVVYNSCTYNSVNMKTSISSWGTGYGSGSNRLAPCVCSNNATASNWLSQPRQVKWIETTSLTNTGDVTTANSQAYDGGWPIKGATPFKVAGFGSTDVGNTWQFDNTTRYTPPAPLQSITYTQTQNSTNVRVAATITGGNSTNNSGNTVTTYYRYSTNGGSTYSSWASAGTGTAWTAKSANIDVPYGASVRIQAKQAYNGAESAVKEISFTATNGTAPSAGTLTITGSTWNSITLAASGVNYGKPDGISGRKIAIGVHAYNDNTTKRENQVENVTSATTTVNNNSVYPSGTALQLKGMAEVYPYLWVWNTKQSAYVVNQTSPYYLPPAPGTSNYTDDGDGDYTINYSGVAANNVVGYSAANLTRTVRYKIGSGDWVYIENASQIPLATVTSEQIHVPFARVATVEAWLTYRGKNSDVTTFTIINQTRPAHLYGSVAGLSKEVQHLYGPVNGRTKKIKKLYGSAGGVAKEVFEDV